MLHPAIKKQKSPVHGWGLFATEVIPKGTIVWSEDDDSPRYTFEALVQLPPEVSNLCHVAGGVYILGSGDSRYMNHSCDPNAACLGDDALVAIRDIQPGEEVAYDYATSEIDEWLWPDWECGCGAPNCRRVVSVRDCLNPAFRERYKDHLPSWAWTYIREHETDSHAV